MRPPVWLRLPILLLAVAALTAAAVPGSAAAAPALPWHSATFVASPSSTHCNARNRVDSLRPLGPPQVIPGSFMATIRHRGYLIAGVTQNTYPFGFFNPLDGQTEGFEIEILRAIAKAILGSPKIEFRAISDAQREREIQHGTVDIVAHTMTINCSRLKAVDFSSVYFIAGAQVLVLKNSRVRSLADLAGKKVCATATSDSLGYIKTARTPIPFVAPNFTDCLMRLQQGDVAAISTDNAILAGLRHQDPWTKIVGPPFSSEPYGLAISKKHADFVRFVNAVLQQMRTDGQWAADYRHWVGTPVPAPPAAKYQA